MTAVSPVGRNITRAAIVVVFRLLSVLAGLAYVKYYTNALSIDQVGTYFYLGTLSYVLNALVFVPIDSYMQARISDLSELPYPALRRLVCTTLLAALGICAALSTPLMLIGKLSMLDIPLLYGMAALLYLCTSIRSLLNIRGHSTFASSMVLLEAVGRLLAFAAVAWILGASAQSLLLSSIVALGFELIVLCWKAGRVLPLSGASDALDPPSRVLRITSALAGGAASNTVQLQAYRVLFPAAGYASTSAALGVTANIGAVAMSACSQVFSQLFLPKLYRTRGAWIGRYVGWAVAMTATLLTFGLLLSDFLVQHLTQAAYLPYAPAIGIGIVIEASNMLIGAYSVYLTLHGRAIMLFWFQLVGAIISLSACMIMLNWRPDSPLLLGLAVAGSQLIVIPALGFYVYRLCHRSN